MNKIYHISEAIDFALAHADDRDTKVGAIIHTDNEIVAMGSNEFRCDHSEVTEKMYVRPLKYEHIFHAEDNAIYDAALKGVDIKGLSMSCTHPSCASCASKVIAAGIKTVYIQSIELMEEGTKMRWMDSWLKALKMYTEAGVKVIEVK